MGQIDNSGDNSTHQTKRLIDIFTRTWVISSFRNKIARIFQYISFGADRLSCGADRLWIMRGGSTLGRIDRNSSRSLLEATTLQINNNRMAPITARYRVTYCDALQDDMIASKNNTSPFTSSGHTARQMAILKCFSPRSMSRGFLIVYFWVKNQRCKFLSSHDFCKTD